MPGIQPGWTRKERQHFPLLTVNEKLSLLYIPEALWHYAECYINQRNMTNKYISQKWSGNTKQKIIITGLNFKKIDFFKRKQCWLCHTTMGAHNLKIQMLYIACRAHKLTSHGSSSRGKSKSSLNPVHLKQREKKSVNLVSTFVIQTYHISAGNCLSNWVSQVRFKDMGSK